MSKNFEILKRLSSTASESTTSARVRELNIFEPREFPRDFGATSTEAPHARGDGVLRILRRHWRASALAGLVVLATVLAWTALTEPVFEPVARLEIIPPGSETFSLDKEISGNGGEYIHTQVHNLRSDELIISTIRDLHLQQHPEFVRAVTSRADSSGTASSERDISKALAYFQKHWHVTLKTNSQLVEVSFLGHDPLLATNITNRMLDLFIDSYYKARADAVSKSSNWLSHQLDDIRTQANSSTQRLADFQRATGIADIDDGQSTLTQRLSELNRQLAQSEAERIQLESLVAKIDAGSGALLPEIRNDSVIDSLSKQRDELQAKIAQNEVLYGKKHPSILTLRAGLAELNREITVRRESRLSELRTSYSAALTRERLLTNELRSVTNEWSGMATYGEMKKEAQANSELYKSLYARVKEAAISAASRSSNMRIVDHARIPDRPAAPNWPVNLEVGILAALLAGIIVAYIREIRDDTVRTLADVRLSTGLFNVYVVPAISASTHRAPDAFSLTRPSSLEAEAIRGLYTSIMLSSSTSGPQVILVTSPFPRDGKTTIATNLAARLSHRASTCLVDADLRRTTVSDTLGNLGGIGLRQVLLGTASLQSVLIKSAELTPLSILPAGTAGDCPGCDDAGELMLSDGVPHTLGDLRQRFTYIVIDSPPVLPYADARALAALSDAIVLVGRYGATTREALVRSTELLKEVHGCIRCVVLNAADTTSEHYRYYAPITI